ncbi:MAG: hypothetical protein QXJ06_05420 [Candidatus Aenigmatarchaeota archaeon]
MEEKLFLVGIVLIFIGFLMTFISTFLGGNKKVDFAFGGFIGPIPFGWATNEKILIFIIIIMSIILFSLFLLK